MKCAHQECARDAQKRWLGRTGQPGRAPACSTGGVYYCKAHYEQLRRGKELTVPRARGVGPYATAVEDCATIADFHGHADLAALLRKLNP